MKFKDFQAPVLFVFKYFQGLEFMGKKFKYFQRCVGTLSAASSTMTMTWYSFCLYGAANLTCWSKQ